MKKTVTVNLAGIVFHIEEDAYSELLNYLDAIGRKFSNGNERKEIIEDIEIRISELFKEKLTQYKEVITTQDVSEVIEIMGAPETFDSEEEEEEKEEEVFEDKKKTKKLYRDVQNKQIAGVCSGIAHYLNIETTIVRAIFVISLLAGGAGLIVYAVLWAIVPEKEFPESESISKKLYRDTDNSIIGGVCAGVAQYFGWETSVVRVVLALLFIFMGFGGIIYLILWAIIPEAKSTSEKLAMKGKKANLKNIEDFFKQFKNSAKDKKKAKKNEQAKPVYEIIKYQKPDNDWIKNITIFIQKMFSSVAGTIFLAIGTTLIITALFVFYNIENFQVTGSGLSSDTEELITIMDNYISETFWIIYGVSALIFSIGLAFIRNGILIVYYKSENIKRRLKPIKTINTLIFISFIISIIMVIKDNKIRPVYKEEIKTVEINYKHIIIKETETTSGNTNKKIKLEVVRTDEVNTPTFKLYTNSAGLKSKKTPFKAANVEYEINDSIITYKPYLTNKLLHGQKQEVDLELMLPVSNDYNVTFE